MKFMSDEEILELQLAEVELLEAGYENELEFETKEVCLGKSIRSCIP